MIVSYGREKKEKRKTKKNKHKDGRLKRSYEKTHTASNSVTLPTNCCHPDSHLFGVRPLPDCGISLLKDSRMFVPAATTVTTLALIVTASFSATQTRVVLYHWCATMVALDAARAAVATAPLTRLFDDREDSSLGAAGALRAGRSYGGDGPVGNLTLVSGCPLVGSLALAWYGRVPRAFASSLLLPCRFFGRPDDAGDEGAEPLAVTVRWDRGYLVFGMRETSPEMFQTLDEAVLLSCCQHTLPSITRGRLMHAYMGQAIYYTQIIDHFTGLIAFVSSPESSVVTVENGILLPATG